MMTNFETILESETNILNENMSFASVMELTDLRALYYGRIDMYVSFTDDGDFRLSGYESGKLERPYGIKSYTVENVVGRKASSPDLYGIVFRRRGSGRYLSDIRSYSQERLNEDLELLDTLSYVDKDDLESAKAAVLFNPRMRRNFEKFWNITKRIADRKGQSGDKFWSRMLDDLGYSGFEDPSGLGIIGKRGELCSIWLDEKSVEMFDIVPIQKRRRDPRRRIRDKIDREVKKMHSRRNRVAKQPTNDNRGDSKTIQKNLLQRLLS